MIGNGKDRLLGLAILSTRLLPGQVHTYREMSEFCRAAGENISRQRLHQIEDRALRKLRIALTKNGCGLVMRD